mmetsp:Transcript_21353/g.51786  ORF Transcript_21353/g.51786 Transcript_21353/m.51786 type:complete len:226 (+) Transcript_21353:1499-2176(+)
MLSGNRPVAREWCSNTRLTVRSRTSVVVATPRLMITRPMLRKSVESGTANEETTAETARPSSHADVLASDTAVLTTPCRFISDSGRRCATIHNSCALARTEARQRLEHPPCTANNTPPQKRRPEQSNPGSSWKRKLPGKRNDRLRNGSSVIRKIKTRAADNCWKSEQAHDPLSSASVRGAPRVAEVPAPSGRQAATFQASLRMTCSCSSRQMEPLSTSLSRTPVW